MQTRAAIIYYGSQFWEQVLAVVPITMCLVAVMAIYFQETVNAPAELAGGLIAAMIGLVLFVDGLRVAIMPLGSMLGQQLPEQFKVRYILVVACAMGILCTYAEPAIAGLRPLANLVQRFLHSRRASSFRQLRWRRSTMPLRITQCICMKMLTSRPSTPNA